MSRPQNHVTREREARLAAQAPRPLPEIPEDLLQALEADYPPRCLEPRETVEDHLRYAGKVDLIARLRREHEERKRVAIEEADLASLIASGERAS